MQTLAEFPPDQNCEGVTAPHRPDGWISVRTGAGTAFFTVTDFFTSAPNAFYTDDPASVSNKLVQTPEFNVVTKGRVTFQQKVDLEAGDGAALEIAIGAGEFRFTDIIAAGGSFVTGAYDATMQENGNPLHSASAWSGDSGGFRTVTINLPRSADGQTVKLQWHVGADASGGGGASGTGGGYWIDDIHVDVDGSITDRIFCNGLETASCE